MKKKKVLIITHTRDNICIETVSGCIRDMQGEAIRLDVDRYPTDYKLTTVYRNNQWKVLLDTGSTVHDLDEVVAVWFRRSFNIGKGISELLGKEYVEPSIGEIKRTMYGMLEGLRCFKMERYSTYRRLDSKEEQLRIAHHHGLLVPDTCITNDPSELKAFIRRQDGPVITKMQHSFALYREQEEYVVFTNEMGPEHLDDLETLQYCPMTFQQKLEKKLELRVTIVGNKIFAFSVDSQKIANAGIDWRKEGAALLNEWQPYTLPESIQSRLLAFMDSYPLNYGAIDIILTPDDKYYFLEVNAAGEYFWLDRLCDHAISRHMAAVLLGEAWRREQITL